MTAYGDFDFGIRVPRGVTPCHRYSPAPETFGRGPCMKPEHILKTRAPVMSAMTRF